MSALNWAMAWTLVLYVIDAIGVREFPLWLIILPVFVVVMFGLLAMIVMGVKYGEKENEV